MFATSAAAVAEVVKGPVFTTSAASLMEVVKGPVVTTSAAAAAEVRRKEGYEWGRSAWRRRCR